MILLTTMTLAFFQNCGSTENQSGSDSKKPETVLESANKYTQITYDPYLEVVNFRPSADAPPRLGLDLARGQIEIQNRSANTSYSCAIDAPRLSALRDLLASASICEPGPFPAGTATCMAMSMADIRLSNGTESIDLRPLICASGVFLCQGADEKLRAILTDLAQYPPENCQ